MLFSNQRKHKVDIPEVDDKGNKPNITWLVQHLCDNVMQDSRKELFVLDDSV
jgi:ubiquitin related modifier 1